ncbi:MULTISPECIES: sigma-70 family RNA polymerase sigma factor [Rhodomicrobium]|uniref:sigma-70 family RNA polymerase sigma factor n=1 Tax=Rhodomicrobium TaxID=1068 RepID=UPI0014834DFC|nr:MULTISPECIES: sigma-70 family RNA polymerase sigma factor [Rhodomicrobium]
MGDQLKKSSLDQDAGAFRSLFLTFGPKIRAMLMRQGADRDMAETIAQDAMLAVWRKSHQLADGKGTISAWIYAIARNLRIGRVRQQTVWQRFHQEVEAAERLRGPAFREPERGGIEGALGALPPEELQVLQLSFVEGLSQTEIAAKLDLPLGTVKSRMRLAFDSLCDPAEGRS